MNDLEDNSTEQAEALLSGENQRLKKQLQEQLASDVEAFLSRGGQVQQIADNVRADPPRKPDLQYGSGAI